MHEIRQIHDKVLDAFMPIMEGTFLERYIMITHDLNIFIN